MTAEEFTTEVLDSSYYKPVNGEGGWYVYVKYLHGYGAAAMNMAMVEASKNGYNPDGRARTGMPSAFGLRTSCVSFWFYEKKEG